MHIIIPFDPTIKSEKFCAKSDHTKSPWSRIWQNEAFPISFGAFLLMEPLQFPGRPSTGVYGYRETVSVLGVWCHKMAPLRQPRISSGLTMPPDGHIFNQC